MVLGTRRALLKDAKGTMRFVAIAVLALALLQQPAQAQPRSGGAMPFVNQRGCPSGYYLTGGFCAPLN